MGQMDEIRMAVVGLGRRGREGWIPLLQQIDGYRITAVCDPIASLHEPALAKLERPQSVRVYQSLDDVLADADVDAVALTLRCRQQGALAARALRAGKHVHCEVPAAHTIQDCWDIVLAVEQTGLVYQLAEQTRYWGFVQSWRSIVADDLLGHITLCEGQYFHFGYVSHGFQDPQSGRFYRVDDAERPAGSRPTWAQEMPPIHYLPHELGPMLYILRDRVTDVVGMSTRTPSYAFPQVHQPDMQMALMKTEKDTILRMGVSFAQPHPHLNYHWYQLVGTKGRVEWKRADRDRPKIWLANRQMHDLAEVDWRRERVDAPELALRTGHSGADYYPQIAFRDAVIGVTKQEFDVYAAIETAAPAILAATSIDRGSAPVRVPDFRPGPERPPGEPPKAEQA